MLKRRPSILRGYLLIILFMITPILLTLTAGLLANLMGVEMKGGGPPDCFGGKLLYSMAVSAYAAIITIPLGVVFLVIYTICRILQPLTDAVTRRKEEEQTNLDAEFGDRPADPWGDDEHF